MVIEHPKSAYLWVRGVLRLGIGHLLGDEFTKLAGRFDLAHSRRHAIRPLAVR